MPAPSAYLTCKRVAAPSLLAAAPKKRARSCTLTAKQVNANTKCAATKAKNAALKATSTPILATRRLAASSARTQGKKVTIKDPNPKDVKEEAQVNTILRPLV